MIEIDATEFVKWLKAKSDKLYAEAQTALKLVADAAAFHAKNSKSFKNKTGALRKSIRGQVMSNSTARTIASVRHAYWVENGNNPGGGRIYPKKSKFLRFQVDGVTYYRKWVRAAAPRKYMHAAREAVVPLFEQLVQFAVNRTFHG